MKIMIMIMTMIKQTHNDFKPPRRTARTSGSAPARYHPATRHDKHTSTTTNNNNIHN